MVRELEHHVGGRRAGEANAIIGVGPARSRVRDVSNRAIVHIHKLAVLEFVHGDVIGLGTVNTENSLAGTASSLGAFELVESHALNDRNDVRQAVGLNLVHGQSRGRSRMEILGLGSTIEESEGMLVVAEAVVVFRAIFGSAFSVDV